MSLPYMSDKSMMRDVVRRQFGGLNNNLAAQDGEITWMQNMSSREFPLLCPRDRRGLTRTLTSPKGIGAQDEPFWAANGKFYYAGEEKGTVDAATEKQFAVIGSRVIIFPDKKYYDTRVDKMGDMGDKFGNMELSQSFEGLSFKNGEISGVPAESNPLYAEAAAEEFSAGDAVTISGCTIHPENNKTAIVREVDGDYLRFYEGTFVLDTTLQYTVGIGGLPAGTYHFEEGQFSTYNSQTFSGVSFQNGTLGGVAKRANTIYKAGAAWQFSAGETIVVTGCTTHPANNKTAVIREVDGDYLRFDEDTWTLDGELVYTVAGEPLAAGNNHGQYWFSKGEFNIVLSHEGSIWAYDSFPVGSTLTWDEANSRIIGVKNNADHTVVYKAVSPGQTGDYLEFVTVPVNYSESGSITVASASATISEGATLTWNGASLDVDDNGSTYQLPVTAGDAGTYLVFAEIPTDYTESAEVTVARSVPDLDYICVNENRLWGCKGDTIYASALGDPFNFNVFDGLSTDSWQSDTTDAGDFTGCISYQGYPIFFKEDSLYKVQGDGATNFAWTRTSRFGVKAGSHKSLAVAGETLFYLSRVGVCAYQGGMPTVVSDPLGVNTKWESGVAGSDGLRYYVDLYDGTAHSLYVFDTRYRAWHREDASQALGFAFWDGGLHMLCTDGKLWRMDGSSGTRETSLAWEVIFADSVNFYETSESGSERKKGPLRMLIRAALANNVTVTVKISYDDGDDMTVGTLAGGGKKQTYVLPMILRRCDHYRLRLEGNGEAVIYSMSTERYNGSVFQGTGTVN